MIIIVDFTSISKRLKKKYQRHEIEPETLREREREITRFLFEVIKNNIGGFVFFFGAFKASNERENFFECFWFDVVASDFALFLNFLLR